ncbi:MAG: transporter substrate-binding domain-containing protein [Oleiphilaceae bacterium]|nr:transporter substrate-binding domain-containing protein [Oleiphilaceae bacterium]
MQHPGKLLWLVLLFCLQSLQTGTAQTNVRVVTDAWAPYAFESEGKLVGADVDVAYEVFKSLGVGAHIEILPWKRCLSLVKEQKADAILAVSLTEKRKSFLHYPTEPVSYGQTVFFAKQGHKIDSINLNNPFNLRVGAMLGYSYCHELDESRLLDSASRVSSLEQNFKKLLLGRIDLLVEVDAVGLYTAKQLGVADKVKVVPSAPFCFGGNYLAFAKKTGMDVLSQSFSDALIEFKKTPQYNAILAEYGLLE